jgi:hypothetical protein
MFYPGQYVWKAAISYVVSQMTYLFVLKPAGANTRKYHERREEE